MIEAWVLWGLRAGPLLRPAYHGNGLDELACLVLPLVLLGVVMLLVMRRGPVPGDEGHDDEADADPFR